MTRDLRRLADSRFDVIVIGGGIYGTTVAWDATQRGLSVALVDRDDFGGGTSFNSAKTVHGGVRALQTGSLGELRLFLGERRALCRIAPHLVEPLPFVIPTYGRVMRNRWLLGVFFATYDVLSRRRNDGVDPARHLPPSRRLSRDECLALNPTIDPVGVTGGIEWHDCQMQNSDRLNLAFLQSATDGGAMAANYAEVTGLLSVNRRVAGVEVYDRIGGHHLDIQGKAVLNCGGPWAPSLLRQLLPGFPGSGLPALLSKAMNLVSTKPLGTTHACGSWVDGRLLFAAPWRGRSIVGTSHHHFEGTAGPRPVRRDEVEHFLAEVNRAFPRAGMTLDDVGLVHCGLLPAAQAGGRPDALRKASIVTDHRADGMEGLVSVLGVRYTTARDTAQQAVDTVFAVRGQPAPRCLTSYTPIAGGDIADVDRFLRDAETGGDDVIDGETCQRLARAYGTAHTRLLAMLRERPDDAAPLGVTCRVTRGEIRYAAREEMAMKLSDALLRRTEAGSAGHPGADALESAAAVMADELGWSPDRIAQEVALVEGTYAVPD